MRPLVSVIDDDQSVSESLPDLLKAFGFSVRAFASAEDFLASDCPTETRCVLLDIAMPGMTGPELQDLLGQRLPIVFITAHADDATRSRVISAGAVDCLLKPFTEDSLLKALNTATGRANAASPDSPLSVRPDCHSRMHTEFTNGHKGPETRCSSGDPPPSKWIAEDDFAVAADALPGLVWTARPDGTLSFVNRRWLEYAGIDWPDPSVVWHLLSHPNPPDVKAALETVRRSIRDSHRASDVIKRLRALLDQCSQSTRSHSVEARARHDGP